MTARLQAGFYFFKVSFLTSPPTPLRRGEGSKKLNLIWRCSFFSRRKERLGQRGVKIYSASKSGCLDKSEGGRSLLHAHQAQPHWQL